MAADDPKVAAMKTGIISHMNADHGESLSLYLRYYNRLPRSHADTAKLEDITLEHMVISSSFGTVRVPIKPRMKSLADAREKLVAMHFDALNGLGLSKIVVKEYRLPNRAYQWFNMITCALVFLTFPFRDSLAPASGSWASWIWSLGGTVPQIAQLAYQLQPVLLPIVVVLHSLEATWMARSRLAKHQVKLGSVLWWKWAIDTWVEGFGAMKRFDGIVEEIKASNANGGKH